MDKTNYKDVCLAYTCIILKIVFCSTNMHALVDLVKIPTYPCVFMCNLRWQAWRIDKRRWEMQAWIWKKKSLTGQSLCSTLRVKTRHIWKKTPTTAERSYVIGNIFMPLYPLWSGCLLKRWKERRREENKRL